jgi:formimidoylglutamate deiminase
MSELTLPGFVNAHSHTFQRALRGRVEGDDFWGWRQAMIAEAEAVTPAQVAVGYERTYREMHAAGYTAVGEFHYIGQAEAAAAIQAAKAAGIELVLLAVAYGRGGVARAHRPARGAP